MRATQCLVVLVLLAMALIPDRVDGETSKRGRIAAPTHVEVEPGHRSVCVTFQAPTLPDGVTVQRVEASFTRTDGRKWSAWARAQSAEPRVCFGGLRNGVSTRLRLRVVTTAGRSAPSATSEPFTPFRATPTAAPVPQPSQKPTVSVEIVVSTTGDDAAEGTRAAPLRTLRAAWARIPVNVTLDAPHTIVLLAGDFAASTMPHYWEWRLGTAAAPLTIRSDQPGRPVTLRGDLNLFEVHHLTVQGLRIIRDGDAVHCERCTFFTLHDVELDGGSGAWETLKINQSSDVTVRNSTLRRAGDNVIDLVAVQRATISDNVISGANDWCCYAKGGSAAITFERNEVSQCGTGGITAGQGTGLEWMVAPWLTYEATDVVMRDNHVFDVEGAAFGVNGGRNVLIEGNRAERVGRRSHLVEVTFGSRSCDGNSARCAELLRLGAWGTSTVGGDVYAHIPNRDVVIRNNAILNPTGYRSAWQHFEVSAPRSNTGARVAPSPARTDQGLIITGNTIVNGDTSMPLGIEGTTVCTPTNPTCTVHQIWRDNDINGA